MNGTITVTGIWNRVFELPILGQDYKGMIGAEKYNYVSAADIFAELPDGLELVNLNGDFLYQSYYQLWDGTTLLSQESGMYEYMEKQRHDAYESHLQQMPIIDLLSDAVEDNTDTRFYVLKERIKKMLDQLEKMGVTVK